MVSSDELCEIAFFQDLDPTLLAELRKEAEIRDYAAGDVLTHQHDRAIALYFLIEGKVQFLVHVSGVDDLLVDATEEPGSIIGWSLFREPFRYVATTRCESPCRLLRLPRDPVERALRGRPEVEREILGRVAARVARRLELVRSMLVAAAGEPGKTSTPSPQPQAPSAHPPAETAAIGRDRAATVAFLRHATFFEGFPVADLEALATRAGVLSAERGALFLQDEPAKALYLLIEGRIELRLSGPGGEDVLLRSLTDPGQAFGWSALVEPYRYHISAVAAGPVQTLAFAADHLAALAAADARFGARLMQRALWVIGNRLRAVRTQLIAHRYHRESLTVRALLEQSADSLRVTSPLHKIPYLLENRLTVSDAFDTLELVKAHGDEVERSVAGMALQILPSVRRELSFYQGLQRIYEAIAHAPAELGAAEVRRRCMEEFRALFAQTDYRIAGAERLPARGGCLVVMNHLENDMSSMLPNEFRLTMDTHFVSSMILDPHYGRAPVRVVRKPGQDWYGFQQYFDRLGYIYVYGGELDEEDRDRHLTPQERADRFLCRAQAVLRCGDNLVICPEGQCYRTEDSPGPFKTGAFRLAAAADPEPLIVPIAVANFDKKLTRVRTAAVVFPPLRMSDEVDNLADRDDIRAFVRRLNERYRGYVEEARRLAAE